MRKITQQAARAFIDGRKFSSGNTTVTVDSEGYIVMSLHGNIIAKRGMMDTQIQVTLAGWGTPTTRERVNGLLTEYGVSAGFYQRNHLQYYGGTDHSANPSIDSTAWVHVDTRPTSVDLPELDKFFS